MSGWIYCITNSLYKMDDMYKLGYTSNKQSQEIVKQHLIQRYGTYFPDVEIIDLFEVKFPLQAERKLFELLKDYKNDNEIVKADFEMIIKPQLECIQKLFHCNNERLMTEQEKQKYITKFTKKIKNFITHFYQIQNYISLNIDNFNKYNLPLIINFQNCLSYYNGYCFPPIQDKKMMKFLRNDLQTNLTHQIQQFDYNDCQMVSFVDYVANLL